MCIYNVLTGRRDPDQRFTRDISAQSVMINKSIYIYIKYININHTSYKLIYLLTFILLLTHRSVGSDMGDLVLLSSDCDSIISGHDLQ